MQRKDNIGEKTTNPRVWILVSPHTGDNTQLKALALALGWPVEVKELVYRKRESVLRFLGLASLAGVDLTRSSELAKPWPDLVLCAGRGAEAVGFWLKRTKPDLKTVFVGTPWSDPSRFDLVIASAQYGLADAPNVLNTALPLHDVSHHKIAAAAAAWAEHVRDLPEPRIAVLVGGNSGPYLFTPRSAARLAAEASARARQSGGSLLVTTSPRTPAAVTSALAQAIGVPHELHRWHKDQADNPFHAYLGLASEIIVTADSISMLSEAVASGKPVAMFDIEEGRLSMRAEEGKTVDDGRIPPIGWRGRTLSATLFRLLMNHAPARWSRDLRIVHRKLVETGAARWMGEEFRREAIKPETAMAEAVARIRRLFGL